MGHDMQLNRPSGDYQRSDNPQLDRSQAQVQGEGDYQAGEAYNRETSAAAHDKAATAQGARAAADALDGPERDELEAARRQTGSVKPQ